jgi:hypothetical protein
MLKSVYGMDIQEFIEIVVHIAEKRIANGWESKIYDKFTLGHEHVRYDIKMAKHVLYTLIKEPLDEKQKLIVENCLNKIQT